MFRVYGGGIGDVVKKITNSFGKLVGGDEFKEPTAKEKEAGEDSGGLTPGQLEDQDRKRALKRGRGRTVLGSGGSTADAPTSKPSVLGSAKR